MRNKLILVGGGGHCKSCIDVIESKKEYVIVGILDKPETIGKTVSGYSIIGSDEDIKKYVNENCYFLVTVGQIESAQIRIRVYNKIKEYGGRLATIVSNRAYIAKATSIGEGTIIMHDALVNTNSTVGNNCIINTKSLIEHDCKIGDHCHVSTSSTINGGVVLGNKSFVGSNSVTVQSAKLDEGSFIKANTRSLGRTKKRIAFLTTIYPISDTYVDEFFDSLNNQTEKEFDVIVINDGYSNFNKVKVKYKKLTIIELACGKSIAHNRELSVNYARCNGYDVAIFGDIDDKFSENRIKRSVEELTYVDVVVNELMAIKNDTIIGDKIYSGRLYNREIVDFEYIKDKNVFGLSNTAINLNVLKEPILLPDDLVAVDWYIFSLILSKGAKAVFINDILTFYRQHNSNTVGISKFTIASIKHIIDVKIVHYEHMARIFDEFKERFIETIKLKESISNEQYLNKLLTENKIIKQPLWWELLVTRSENEDNRKSKS